ncbi:hypothetical protein Tco_0951169 [Tanacetum coccineum]|uniref:Zinc finger, CCHC-type n=1 Tax=Tanacetum coccineum TaxID=301880 RepID=A0ABQ5DU99_9ASTR
MTITIVNNLVFKAFFEKQKLTGPNFINWYHNLWIVLSVEDKLTYLEHLSLFLLLDKNFLQMSLLLILHTTYVKDYKEIAGLMLMTMDTKIQKIMEQLGAYDMLKELKTLFSQQEEPELL